MKNNLVFKMLGTCSIIRLPPSVGYIKYCGSFFNKICPQNFSTLNNGRYLTSIEIITNRNYNNLTALCQCRSVNLISRGNSSVIGKKRKTLFEDRIEKNSKVDDTFTSANEGAAIEPLSRSQYSNHKDQVRSLTKGASNKITLLSILPKRYETIMHKVDPYMKLMRMDKPVGTWLLFWPCGWSVLLASGLPVPLTESLRALGLCLLGAFIMRGAGCTINDLWDKDIDAKVERTKSRPLVSGQISKRQAFCFLAAQLSVGLSILLQFNWYSVALGASSLVLVVLYPLAKRVTYYPQLVLGLTFNWGALLGWAILRGEVEPSVCLPLYTAGVCWTLLYDTIYAHQDKKDDAIIGIKSTALRFGEYTKPWLWTSGCGMLGGLVVAGVAADLAWPYHAVLGLVAAHLATQISTLNMDNPSDCADKFISNSTVGFLIFLGIILGKWECWLECLPKKSEENLQGA